MSLPLSLSLCTTHSGHSHSVSSTSLSDAGAIGGCKSIYKVRADVYSSYFFTVLCPTTTRQSSASAVSRAEVNDLSRVTITISSWQAAIMNEQVPLFFDQRKKLVATFCEPKCFFFDRTFECVCAFFFIHFILFLRLSVCLHVSNELSLC